MELVGRDPLKIEIGVMEPSLIASPEETVWHHRFQTLLQINSNPVLLVGRDGHVLDLNRAAEMVFGGFRSDFIDRLLISFLPAAEAVLDRKSTSDFMTDFEDGRGRKRTLIWECLPVRDDRAVAFIIHAKDVTEETRLQLELDASLKELRDQKHALDESAIVAVTDARGRINYVNDKFCMISKYSRQELIGKDHRIINSGLHSKEFFLDLWKTIASGKVWRGEVRNRAKDGSHYWVHTTIVPFLDGSGQPFQYVAIRTDITDKKLADQRLEEERAKTVQSEKMASLGEMAAGIAHELGNPLATIRGRVEFLEYLFDKGPVEKTRILEIAGTVKNLADRMTRIIRGMRSFARDGSADPCQREDVLQIVRDVLEFSAEKFRKHGIEVELVSCDQERLEAECRETQISQVLVNLLGNSCDAIRELPQRWIRIESRREGDFVELSVTDSGPGIPHEIRKKIFQPFFTTKPVGKGTGLGLGISLAIVESHHGCLMVDSECSNTRFLLRLPVKQPLN